MNSKRVRVEKQVWEIKPSLWITWFAETRCVLCLETRWPECSHRCYCRHTFCQRLADEFPLRLCCYCDEKYQKAYTDSGLFVCPNNISLVWWFRNDMDGVQDMLPFSRDLIRMIADYLFLR